MSTDASAPASAPSWPAEAAAGACDSLRPRKSQRLAPTKDGRAGGASARDAAPASPAKVQRTSDSTRSRAGDAEGAKSAAPLAEKVEQVGAAAAGGAAADSLGTSESYFQGAAQTLALERHVPARYDDSDGDGDDMRPRGPLELVESSWPPGIHMLANGEPLFSDGGSVLELGSSVMYLDENALLQTVTVAAAGKRSGLELFRPSGRGR